MTTAWPGQKIGSWNADVTIGRPPGQRPSAPVDGAPDPAQPAALAALADMGAQPTAVPAPAATGAPTPAATAPAVKWPGQRLSAPAEPLAPAQQPVTPGVPDARTLPEARDMTTGDTWEDIKLAAKSLFTSDPEELATVFGKALPDAKIERDAAHNPVISYRGQRYALNRPGMSAQDFIPIATALAESVGIGGLVRGGLAAFAPSLGARMAASFGGRAAREATIGAATGLVNAEGRRQSGADVGAQDYAGEATAGAAGGVGGEFLSTLLGQAFRGLRQGILDSSGQLTAAARAAAAAAGIDLQALDQGLLRQIDGSLRGRVVSPTNVGAATRQATADAYGMPLSMGEATRDPARLAWEEAARNGAKGRDAQGAMQELRTAQQQRLPSIIETVAQRTAPGAVIHQGEAGIGDEIVAGLRSRAATSQRNVDQLYQRARDLQQQLGVTLPPAAHGDLMSNVTRELQGRAISPELAPATNWVLRRLDSLQNDALDLGQSEIVRKEISSAINGASSKEDRAAALKLRQVYDDWVDQTVSALPSGPPPAAQAGGPMGAGIIPRRPGAGGGMPQSPQGIPQGAQFAPPGPREVYQALKDARSAAREHFGRFTSRGSADPGGDLIERMINPNGPLEPQAAVNEIMGDTRTFSLSGAAKARRVRETLGADSQEWQTIQRGMVRRILLGGADQQATGIPEWKTMLDRLNKALAGNAQNKTLDALGNRGVQEMEQLRGLLQSLEVPAEALNRSGSGWALLRAGSGRTGSAAGAAVGSAAGLLSTYLGLPAATAAGIGGGAAFAGGLAGRQLESLLMETMARRAASRWSAAVRPIAGEGGGSAAGAAIGLGIR